MKKLMLILIVILAASCKETPKSVDKTADMAEKAPMGEKTMPKTYPEALNKVLEAHGGLANWKSKATLSFMLPKPKGDEIHTIDLKNRNGKIETPDYSMGYDGKDFWLLDKKGKYKGDPVFYHNLIFYFYGMPFVLADDGINYGETENLEFEGKSYPGIRISYNDGVGVSSKDEYFLYYDADTNQMAWLGYTVTYRSGEKSDKVSLQRYNDWQELGGLLLPKSMTSYKVEDGKLVAPRNTRNFENVTLSETPMPDGFYSKPKDAKVVAPK